MFKVQKKACATCIYRKDSTLNLKALEAAVADPHMKGYFKGHRVCHHSKDVCCRGFWNRHKDKFTAGQLAQRLKAVLFVEVDTLAARDGDIITITHRDLPGESTEYIGKDGKFERKKNGD